MVIVSSRKSKIGMWLLCGSCAIFGTFYLCSTVWATGVSPGIIKIKNVLSGTEYKSKVTFSRADTAKAAQIKIEIQGKDAQVIAPGVIAEESTFEMKAGQNSFVFPFTINAKELSAGDYEARIKGVILYSDPEATSGSSMGIQSGAISIIQFSVTSDQIEDYTVSDSYISDTEEATPVFINYRLSNNGNVMVRAGKISVKITDQNDAAKIYETEILQDRLPLTAVGSTVASSVQSDLTVSIGDYAAEMVFYNLDGLEIFRGNGTFRSHPIGTLDQKGEIVEFTSDKEELNQSEVIEFTGVLVNIGTAPIKAVYVVEVFLNNKRVEYLKGDSLFVPRGIKTKQSLIYKPQKSGSYTAKGYFTYGITSTEQKTVQFQVSGMSWPVAVAGVGLIVVLIAGTIWYIKRKRKSTSLPHDNMLPPTPPPPTNNIQASVAESADKPKITN